MHAGLIASALSVTLVALSGVQALATDGAPDDEARAQSADDLQTRFGPPPGPPRPPQVAYDACVDHEAGAPCTVVFHERTIDGHCTIDLDASLFCVPDELPPPPPAGGRR